MSKTINGAATSFLYDRLNPVQELQNGSPTANMLTGLGIDEYFQRSDSNGVEDFMTDALGSTLALTDSTGAIQTQYTYEPFGNTTASGTPGTNPFQFTGRENDGNGLYFYRARYYSPTLQRFIGWDPPAASRGHLNAYSYALDDPISRIDPSGLEDPRCDEIRQALAELRQELANAKAENPVDLKDVRGILDLIDLFQAEFEELGCTDNGPDGGGQPVPDSESCPVEPYGQAASPPPAAVTGVGVLLLLLLLAGLPVGA